MVSPPLVKTGPIGNGESFYNLYEELSTTEDAPTIWEGINDTQNNEAPLQQDDVFGVAHLQSVQDPSMEEDARLTQLRSEFLGHSVPKDIDFREMDQMFRRMADDPANASFPFGALEFLPGITRGLIQYIGSLQENIGEIKMKNAELQTIQNKFQGETETNINWLQDENKSPKMDTEASLDIIRRLQKKNDKLEDEIEDLRRDFIKKKELYTSMKAEKESLENQLNVVKSGIAEDSDDQNPRKKRSRIE